MTNPSPFFRLGIFALLCIINTILIGLGVAFGLGSPLTERAQAHSSVTFDFEVAVAQAIADYRAIPDLPFYYREVGTTADPAAGGGVVYAQIDDSLTGENIPGIVEILMVVRRDGAWQVVFPGDPGYVAARSELPESVLRSIDVTPYKIKADPAIARTLLITDYQIPYEHGTWGTVTRSFNIHGTGQIDFDINGGAVTAAKDGTIIYVNDRYHLNAWDAGAWWYWNIVILQHGEHEYSLYGHLEPDSVPAWIKQQCTDDFSQPNCAVPVRAGDVIALEGNTGYSSNPHLHVEFGQQYNLVAYPDTQDINGDGSRTDRVYSGYIYAEHNIAFEGYTPDDIAEWAYGTLQQANHTAEPPPDQSIIRNGDFSAGTTDWTPSGQLSWTVENGVAYFLRLNTAEAPDWAAFRQDTNFGAPANLPLEASVDLGNTSGVAKTITLTVYNPAGSQYGAFRCEFVLPPGAPLQRYAMRGKTNSTWSNIRLQVNVNPPDGAYAATADNIVLAHRPDLTLADTECITP